MTHPTGRDLGEEDLTFELMARKQQRRAENQQIGPHDIEVVDLRLCEITGLSIYGRATHCQTVHHPESFRFQPASRTARPIPLKMDQASSTYEAHQIQADRAAAGLSQ